MGEMRNAKFYTKNVNGKDPLLDLDVDRKYSLRKEYQDVTWTRLAQNMEGQRILLNATMYPQVQ